MNIIELARREYATIPEGTEAKEIAWLTFAVVTGTPVANLSNIPDYWQPKVDELLASLYKEMVG